MRLNVGCGRDVRPGYDNLDMHTAHCAGVIRCDIRALPYPDSSVEEIVAHDVLEHFPRLEWQAVLAEWVRALKPGGTISIQSPEMLDLADALLRAQTAAEWEVVNRRIFGGQGEGHSPGVGMFHYTGFSHAYLRQYCETHAGLDYVEHSHHNSNFTLVMKKR